MDKGQRFLKRLSGGLVVVLLVAAGPEVRAQVNELDLLPLSEAFRLEVSRPQERLVRVRWRIADGYYMYRHRFRFEAAPVNVKHGITLPPGIPKQDPFFGETEIYRHQVSFELPLEDGADSLEHIILRVVSQGCADVGICFPPEARKTRLAVGETAYPKAADPFAPTGESSPLDLFYPSSSQSIESPFKRPTP